MQVETYEVEESTEADGKVAVEAESIALIERMGLHGQQSLIQSQGDVKVRIPYRMLTKQEQAVYREIFTQQTRLDRYAAGPIPLRVLQVASHAQGLFKHVQVWHRDVMDKDPLLVGREQEYGEDGIFLLARWGDALRPFSDLLAEARTMLEIKWRAALNDTEAKVVEMRRNMNDWLDKRLVRGETVYLP